MRSERPEVERLADLQILVSQLADVPRSNTTANTERAEDDVVHSYSLAMTCWFIAEHMHLELDMGKVFKYALIHDLVEVYAGDVPAFSPAEVLAAKKQREHEAYLRLKDEWPDFPEMIEAIEAYEEKIDPESRFVYGVDKLLPTLMVNVGEKNVYWHRRKITEQMMRDLISEKIGNDPILAPYIEELFAWATNPDYFYKP